MLTRVYVLSVIASIMLYGHLSTGNAAETSKAKPAPVPHDFRLTSELTTKVVAGPAWAKNLPIYEVNLDQYKFPRGQAFMAFESHLPVLKEMGIGIIWLMPLHPRGEKKAFGSPYCVRDYLDLNPAFGTKADFKHLVQRAHELGLHILMDWVPNHTSWDNAWITQHPEFYQHDAQGNITQARSWRDVAQLNYGHPGSWNQPLWNAMRDAMTYWVKEYDINGYRCDVAAGVPIEFWNWLRPQLDALKPVFMLAEANEPRHHPAFDMTYEWTMPSTIFALAAGKQPATAIDQVLLKEAKDYPQGAIRMRFLDNHDWHNDPNVWADGPRLDRLPGSSVLQRYNGGIAPLMILCATLPGKPLLYNGQEMGHEKHDPPADATARHQSPVWDFYRRLYGHYQRDPALYEGEFQKLVTNHDDKVYAFMRQRDQHHVLVVLNLSPEPLTCILQTGTLPGVYSELFTDAPQTFTNPVQLPLEPWGYRVYVQ
ncbi:MAG: alpha-glucosidase C-terminal domain-containing protein [Abitibacteriaceae bacterium]|nr:alpha-glucosidase C-terminal domain-containing protein [Abditibacteriaceae bacterium]MBV9863816.1 alpha-glucosidase C-terminal domain-containing protein [Abditibacteriaceae bacterium]